MNRQLVAQELEAVAGMLTADGDKTAIKSAVRSRVRGITVGVTANSRVVIFLTADYDDNGTVNGPVEDVTHIAGNTGFYLLGNYGVRDSRELVRLIEAAKRFLSKFGRTGAASPARMAEGEAPNPLDGLRRQQAVSVVFRLMAPFTKGIFHDEYWQPVTALFKALGREQIPYSITSADYQKNAEGLPTSKTWKFEVEFLNERGKTQTLYGTITAAGAGSISEPLSAYDLVATVN